jgi:dihydroxy-acid dehydratase
VSDEELEVRRAALPAPAPAPATGYRRLFHEHVLGADRGCDLDFCVPPAED